MKLKREIKSAINFIFKEDITEQEYDEAYVFLGKIAILSGIISISVVIA